MNRPSVLCVGSRAALRKVNQYLANNCNYDTVVADNGVHALNHLAIPRVNAVILQYEMPGTPGNEVAYEIKRLRPDVPIIMISSLLSVVEDAPFFVEAAVAHDSAIAVLRSKLDLLMGDVSEELDASLLQEDGSEFAFLYADSDSGLADS